MLTMAWKKSSLSSGNTDNCVEARLAGDGVEVRNSKFPDGPVVAFTRDEWAAFAGGVKLDEFAL